MPVFIADRNDIIKVKRWGGTLAVAAEKSFDFKPLEGQESGKLIQLKGDLEDAAGSTLNVQLVPKSTDIGVVGMETLRGKEEAMAYLTDELSINAHRKAILVANNGSIVAQEITQDQRADAEEQIKVWCNEIWTIAMFVQLGSFTGDVLWWNGQKKRANVPQLRGMNAVQPPSKSRHVCAGGKKTEDELTDSDTFDLVEVSRLKMKALLANPGLRPITGLPGGAKFVMFISLEQRTQIRTDTTDGRWIDISKFITATDEKGERFAKGALGIYDDILFMEHENVSMGVDKNGKTMPNVRRAVLCGAQAIIKAKGGFRGPKTPKGTMLDLTVDPQDYENMLGIACRMIYGFKATRFNKYGTGEVKDAEDFAKIVYSTFAEPPEYTQEGATPALKKAAVPDGDSVSSLIALVSRTSSENQALKEQNAKMQAAIEQLQQGYKRFEAAEAEKTDKAAPAAAGDKTPPPAEAVGNAAVAAAAGRAAKNKEDKNG